MICGGLGESPKTCTAEAEFEAEIEIGRAEGCGNSAEY